MKIDFIHDTLINNHDQTESHWQSIQSLRKSVGDKMCLLGPGVWAESGLQWLMAGDSDAVSGKSCWVRPLLNTFHELQELCQRESTWSAHVIIHTHAHYVDNKWCFSGGWKWFTPGFSKPCYKSVSRLSVFETDLCLCELIIPAVLIHMVSESTGQNREMTWRSGWHISLCLYFNWKWRQADMQVVVCTSKSRRRSPRPFAKISNCFIHWIKNIQALFSSHTIIVDLSIVVLVSVLHQLLDVVFGDGFSGVHKHELELL